MRPCNVRTDMMDRLIDLTDMAEQGNWSDWFFSNYSKNSIWKNIEQNQVELIWLSLADAIKTRTTSCKYYFYLNLIILL